MFTSLTLLDSPPAFEGAGRPVIKKKEEEKSQPKGKALLERLNAQVTA